MRSAQRGSMLVLGAAILITLAAFAVMGFDIGRIYVVRNELQNVADSAALAGANCLTRQSDPASSSNCLSTIASSLNWSRAAARAEDALSENSAANVPISSTDAGHTIEVGYWNLLTHSPSGGTFSTTYTPLTTYDRPAVRVYVRKDAGVNNGPIAMLTRLMFGVTSDVPMYGQAVAVISAPNTVLPHTLVPQVINKCMYDQFWDSTTGTPVLYTGTPADPYNLSTVGQPWELRIGTGYQYTNCESGLWTTFDASTSSMSSANSAQVLKGLINNGNPTSLNIGDTIYVKQGVVADAYKVLAQNYPPGSDVTVIVVDTATLFSLATSPQPSTPIVAFAGFHIDAIDSTSGKYIQGHFIPADVTTGGSGVGPLYGTYTPPRLGY